jgi:cysteine desulfurase
MMPWLLGGFGNPHSRTHMFGWESESAVEKARGQVAQLVGANPKEIIFTSGATESNNISLKVDSVSHSFTNTLSIFIYLSSLVV